MLYTINAQIKCQWAYLKKNLNVLLELYIGVQCHTFQIHVRIFLPWI